MDRKTNRAKRNDDVSTVVSVRTAAADSKFAESRCYGR